MNLASKGFTLVELIVVITILAILGTISFISFTSYNQWARNSIRLDGISKVATILENEKTIGKSLLWYSNGWQEIPTASVSGAPSIIGIDYIAWDINPTAVSVQLRQFSDPVTGDSYKLGITTRKSTEYEVATTIREWSLDVAKIAGTYSPRPPTSFPASGDIGDISITFPDISSIGHFFASDLITGIGIAPGTTVTTVSGDGLTLNIDTPLIWAVTQVSLAEQETAGLILGVGTVDTPVTADSSVVPYSLN